MEYKFFKQEKWIWYFKNPVTGKDMEMIDLPSRYGNVHIFFVGSNEPFTKVVFGDVLGCKTVNEMSRMMGLEESKYDTPMSKFKNFGVASIEKMIRYAEPCLRARFGETWNDSTETQDREHRLAGHVRLEFE